MLAPPRPTPGRPVLFLGEIIRSELGGHDTPSLVAFKARDRSIGEAAVSLRTSAPKNTIGAVRTLAGTLHRYEETFLRSCRKPFFVFQQ